MIIWFHLYLSVDTNQKPFSKYFKLSTITLISHHQYEIWHEGNRCSENNCARRFVLLTPSNKGWETSVFDYWTSTSAAWSLSFSLPYISFVPLAPSSLVPTFFFSIACPFPCKFSCLPPSVSLLSCCCNLLHLYEGKESKRHWGNL